MTSFKKTRELLAGCYLADIISDEEFVLLYDCSFSKNLEIPYEEYGRFNLEEMADSECRAEFRVNKRDLPLLAECLQIPDAFVCNQGSVFLTVWKLSVFYFEGFHTLAGTQI